MSDTQQKSRNKRNKKIILQVLPVKYHCCMYTGIYPHSSSLVEYSMLVLDSKHTQFYKNPTLLLIYFAWVNYELRTVNYAETLHLYLYSRVSGNQLLRLCDKCWSRLILWVSINYHTSSFLPKFFFFIIDLTLYICFLNSVFFL